MLYSSDLPEPGESQLPQYNFVVCDSLMNIGPVSDAAVGISMDSASKPHTVCVVDLFLKSQEFDQTLSSEVVTCSGHGKNGSLCVLQVRCITINESNCIQEGLRPELITVFDLPGRKYAWALYNSKPQTESSSGKIDADLHSFVVITSQTSTMVCRVTYPLMSRSWKPLKKLLKSQIMLNYLSKSQHMTLATCFPEGELSKLLQGVFLFMMEVILHLIF